MAPLRPAFLSSLTNLLPAHEIALPPSPCPRAHPHLLSKSVDCARCRDQVGLLLPASFMSVSGEPSSPFFPFGGGVALTIVTVFILGFLATRAEPALNVLGKTVEQLSKGAFSRKLLVYAVCVGVAIGMSAGATKILFGASLIWFILGKYFGALALTYFSSEDMATIAWDSAGVTTGPVTVPFVLSTGIGFSKATGAEEGFGILTCASVSPIITVLIVDIVRNVMKARAPVPEDASLHRGMLRVRALATENGSLMENSVTRLMANSFKKRPKAAPAPGSHLAPVEAVSAETGE